VDEAERRLKFEAAKAKAIEARKNDIAQRKYYRYEPKIAKKDLEHGRYYFGRCRNAEVARWNATDQKFYHWRTKFGHRFIETIKHPEDEKIYDVFVVEALLEVEPEEVIEFKE
jgi:hypothetical protein